MCVQSVRQRQQILRLILENENVSLHRHTHKWISVSGSRWSAEPIVHSTVCLSAGWSVCWSPGRCQRNRWLLRKWSQRDVSRCSAAVCAWLCPHAERQVPLWLSTHLSEPDVGYLIENCTPTSHWDNLRPSLFPLSSPSEDYIRPIGQSDLQKSISKMKKSKVMGGANALLHAALDWRRVMWLFFFFF